MQGNRVNEPSAKEKKKVLFNRLESQFQAIFPEASHVN